MSGSLRENGIPYQVVTLRLRLETVQELVGLALTGERTEDTAQRFLEAMTRTGPDQKHPG